MPNVHLSKHIQELIGIANSAKTIYKMKFYTNKIEIYNGRLIIPVPQGTSLEIIEKAKKGDKFLHVEIDLQKHKKPRSLSSNAYMWVLCQQIAEALSYNGPVIKKEDVYRRAIKEMFSPVTSRVANEDVADMKEAWESRGIGWICEDAGESTLYGQTNLNFYVGSSQFDTEKMSRLLDGIVQDAESLGLDVKPEEERNEMLKNWEKDRKKEAS